MNQSEVVSVEKCYQVTFRCPCGWTVADQWFGGRPNSKTILQCDRCGENTTLIFNEIPQE